MPLDPKDGIGSYIKDFKKSKAPQFKGKSMKKRRNMAIAAYLDAKDGPQEAKLAGSSLKLFGQLNRSGTKPELNRYEPTKKIKKKVTQKKDMKEGSYKVSIAGLPDMYMDDKTPGALLQKLRKIVKQPSLIQDVERTTDAKKKKAFRQKAQGREVTEYKYDYGTPESVKLMKKQTPGQNEAKDPGEYDYEGDMAKTQLRAMIDQAQDLIDMFEDNENLPEWCQNKITKASDYIKDVYSYMEGQEEEPKEEGYVSMAQQRAVWATRKDGGKGHPDNKKKRKR